MDNMKRISQTVGSMLVFAFLLFGKAKRVDMGGWAARLGNSDIDGAGGAPKGYFPERILL
jgi:hypothetical protein